MSRCTKPSVRAPARIGATNATDGFPVTGETNARLPPPPAEHQREDGRACVWRAGELASPIVVQARRRQARQRRALDRGEAGGGVGHVDRARPRRDLPPTQKLRDGGVDEHQRERRGGLALVAGDQRDLVADGGLQQAILLVAP